MAITEVVVICVSLVICTLMACITYFTYQMKMEQLKQYGITQRTQMKLGTNQSVGSTTSPYMGEWSWVLPIVTELLKVPAIQQLLANKIQAMSPEQISGLIQNVSQSKVE